MDLVDGNHLMNEVEINLNVLCALVLYENGGEIHDVDVAAVDKHVLP